jgi:hypothetical protein
MAEKHSNWPRNAREGMMMLEAERTGVPFLYWRDGSDRLQFLMLSPDRPRVTVGRRETHDVPLPWDSQVSRSHAVMEQVAEDWAVIDGDSTNGSWVNGSQIDGRKRLHDKDHMMFGETRVDYRGATDGSVTTTRAPGSPSSAILTERRKKVLIALCRPIFVERATTPATNPRIAQELHVAVETVKTVMKELFDQFGLGSLPQNEKRNRLVAIVRDYRLLSPHDF